MPATPNGLLRTRWTLIERLKSRDDEASWREFFELYWRLIYHVALRAGLTETEAQDAVQETVISVSRKIGDFKADPAAGSFKAWLLKLARWRILDQIRKRLPEETKRIHRGRAGDSTSTDSTATEERIPDPAASVVEAVWEEEWRNNLVAAALEKLKRRVSAPHFQVFYLNAVKGIPAEKVAAALKIKASQVHLIKHRLSGPFEKAVRSLEANPF